METTEPKRVADILTMKPPFRYTPEILARIMLSDAPDIRKMALFVEYNDGRRLLVSSSGMTSGFLAEAGAQFTVRAGQAGLPGKGPTVPTKS